MSKELFKIKNKGNNLFISRKIELEAPVLKDSIIKTKQNYITTNIPYCYICAAPYYINKIDEFMWNGNIITTK